MYIYLYACPLDPIMIPILIETQWLFWAVMLCAICAHTDVGVLAPFCPATRMNRINRIHGRGEWFAIKNKRCGSYRDLGQKENVVLMYTNCSKLHPVCPPRWHDVKKHRRIKSNMNNLIIVWTYYKKNFITGQNEREETTQNAIVTKSAAFASYEINYLTYI